MPSPCPACPSTRPVANARTVRASDWRRTARHLLLAGAWAGALALAWPGSSQASLHPVQAVTQAAWWTRFDDPGLNALVASASSAAGREVRLTQGYIAWQVLRLREGLARQLMASAEHEQALLQRLPDPARDRADRLAEAAWRIDRVALLLQELADQQQQTLTALAATHGSDTRRMRRLLASHGPADPPVRLPAVPAGAPAPRLVEDLGADPQRAALAKAAAHAATVQRQMQAAQLELQALTLRLQAAGEDGAGPGAITLVRAYQQLLGDVDRYALAAGAVALAWVPLLQRRSGPG